MMRADGAVARVNSGGRFQCGPDWRLDPSRTRTWKDLDLWVLVSGHGHVRTPEGVYPLDAGACLLLRGGQNYDFLPARRHPFMHYWVHFDYVDERGKVLPRRKLQLPPVYRKVSAPDLLLQLLQRTVDSLSKPDGGMRQANRWFGAVLMEVAVQDARPVSAGGGGEQAGWIEAVCAAIRDQPGYEHRVDRMAEAVGYDVAYFSRLFRKHVGVSPRQFISKTRMDAARFLLRDSATSIGHIADALSYHDVHFFSRCFKDENGISPSEFRCRLDVDLRQGSRGKTDGSAMTRAGRLLDR